MAVTAGEFEDKLGKLTVNELSKLHDKIYHEYFDQGTSPLWETGANKAVNIRNFTRWVKGHPDRVQAVVAAADTTIAAKAAVPHGMVPGMRYINIRELSQAKNYGLLSQALSYCHDPNKKCEPYTPEGNLTVAAIRNMSAWANWKSSSLSAADRAVSQGINNLNLLAIMKLNAGRRSNEAALFPEGGTLLT